MFFVAIHLYIFKSHKQKKNYIISIYLKKIEVCLNLFSKIFPIEKVNKKQTLALHEIEFFQNLCKEQIPFRSLIEIILKEYTRCMHKDPEY